MFLLTGKNKHQIDNGSLATIFNFFSLKRQLSSDAHVKRFCFISVYFCLCNERQRFFGMLNFSTALSNIFKDLDL